MDTKDKTIQDKKDACKEMVRKIDEFLKIMNAVTLPNGKTVIM